VVDTGKVVMRLAIDGADGGGDAGAMVADGSHGPGSEVPKLLAVGPSGARHGMGGAARRSRMRGDVGAVGGLSGLVTLQPSSLAAAGPGPSPSALSPSAPSPSPLSSSNAPSPSGADQTSGGRGPPPPACSPSQPRRLPGASLSV
jgi:hypothetical protein